MTKRALVFLFFCFPCFIYAQNCNSNTQQSIYDALNNGYSEAATTSIVPGEYVLVTNVLEHEYTFTSEITGTPDYITIRRNSDDSIIVQGTSPLNYTFFAGDIPDNIIKLVIHLDDSCDSTDNGNHTITLLNETNLPTCFGPESPRVSYLSNRRIDFYWDAPSSGSAPIDYDWEIGLPGFTPGTGNDVAKGSTGGATSASSGETLAASTAYEVAIRSNCGSGDYSIWLVTPSITTLTADPPSNDFCDGTEKLIQETGVANSGAATGIMRSVVGGAGTNKDAESCNGNANARDDVWYAFIAQTTDINIDLTPDFDGILTLFSGDCNSLTQLACADANGGLLPREESIYQTGLIIGDTYYFRVYSQGFSTGSPDFELKLWSNTATTDNDGDGYSNHPDVDCDDTESTIYPWAPEVVDNDIDEDCDGADLKTWYLDSDNDSYGDINNSVLANSQPANYVLDNSDCNDGVAAINPGATEVCDGIDNDCDGDIDDADSSVTGQTVWYIDADGDSYGDSGDSGTSFCFDPGAGYSMTNNDCNDGDNGIHPGATEIAGNGIDEDCNGLYGWYQDNDGDGHGSTTIVETANSTVGTNQSALNDDCNDSDAAIYPGNTEVCDGKDNDCANGADDGLTFTTYYIDGDNDSYGDENDSGTSFCSNPGVGYSTTNDDCDDGNMDVNPGATEIPGNGLDDDCNPATADTLSDEEFNLEHISILPNPFSDLITIQLKNNIGSDFLNIQMLDFNGRSIFIHKNLKANNGIITLNNLQGLHQGIYFIKISIPEGNIVKRLVKI
ncbi:MopE-related protein [Seonamhaeicola maritimus]|uniref:MopE-related protein n=1 Tax=Seonamhaeicola maritimus TaxID=2591822 RepID=UPI002494E8D4|nr:MopE-related protein [Seonamhaeicola maritimus]